MEPRLHVVVVEPKIAGNVGALVRLCAATDCALHICGELPFSADDARLRRPGLDTWALAEVRFHKSLDRCLALLGDRELFVVEVGGASSPWAHTFSRGAALIFGPEDGSVSESLVPGAKARVTLPMAVGVRSLNLAQSAAVMVYEAVRQHEG